MLGRNTFSKRIEIIYYYVNASVDSLIFSNQHFLEYNTIKSNLWMPYSPHLEISPIRVSMRIVIRVNFVLDKQVSLDKAI